MNTNHDFLEILVVDLILYTISLLFGGKFKTFGPKTDRCSDENAT